MSEDERLKACAGIAERMYLAGMGWNYDAIERLTRPQIDIARLFQTLQTLNTCSMMRRKIRKTYGL